MTKYKNRISKDEQGLISIVVAVILMLIMSLVVLAMSQNTRQEQKQTLDRQLSDQAFYNAESGINDIKSYLYKTPTAAQDRKNCNDPLPFSNNIDPSVNKYVCVLYDQAPQTVLYDKLAVAGPKVVPVTPLEPTGVPTILTDLNVSWEDASDPDVANIDGQCDFNSSGNPDLPQECNYGGIEVQVTGPTARLNQPGVDGRDELMRNTLISYLLPSKNGQGEVPATYSNYQDQHGVIGTAKCSNSGTPRKCNLTIKNINRGDTFYLVIKSLYRPVNVSLSGKSNTGNAVRFKGTQVMIDSTGKSADLLRRVQVRVPAKVEYDFPGYSLQSADSICKLYTVTNDQNGKNASPGGEPDCQPN